jgi:N-acetylmuramoyl-L-alanine amidase
MNGRLAEMKRLPILLLLACSIASARPLRVVLDPGHGGTQDGAVGPDGLVEKTLSLQICQRLKAVLVRRLHARVTLTRTRDALVHLSDRVAFANHLRPDVFISIHANSMPTRKLRAATRGVETFFLSASASDAEAGTLADRENAEGGHSHAPSGQSTLAFILADLQRTETHGESSRLAYAVQKALVKATGAEDRGVQQAPFYVLTGVEAPAILVEVGFISNPAEAKRLVDPAYQDRIAEAIVDGLGRFSSEMLARDAEAARPSP